MATQADFNALQWQNVVEGPALAGLIVIAAQRGGTIRESVAMAKAYAEAEKAHGGHDLLGEIAGKAPRVDPRDFTSVEDLNLKGEERIRNAVTTLESKATSEELDAYKQFTITVATRAAEADRSGGLLGVGGEQISDAERTALDRIRGALGLEPESAA